MLRDLSNKVAWITGAGTGIGEGAAVALSEVGMRVALSGRRIDKLEEVANRCPGETVIEVLDVADKKAVNDVAEKIIDHFGGLDVLVASAGINVKNRNWHDVSLEDWDSVIRIDLDGAFYCCKAVTPYMIKNNYGRIVNIASIAGKEGNPNASAYSTSKAGVIGLTKSLGKELALKNIAVNCVTPAAAKTRIFDQMTEEHINYMLSKIPRNKFAKVDELASLVTWLSSEENSFSTAAVFDLSLIHI